MVHFKGKELNEGELYYGFHVAIAPNPILAAGPGHCKTLEEIREALREDVDLLAAMKDEDKMKLYFKEYYDEKEAKSKGKVQRVSGKSMAQAVSKTLNLLQAQVGCSEFLSGFTDKVCAM